jgi:hypothetical protein
MKNKVVARRIPKRNIYQSKEEAKNVFLKKEKKKKQRSIIKLEQKCI